MRGSPERAVADAFSALERRDLAGLAAAVTPASRRDATLALERITERLPELFTNSIRCAILGRVLESRLVDANPDGRGLVSLECRIAGTESEWLSVQCDPRVAREIADRDPAVAHVAFRVAYDLPGRGVVPFPPEFQMATTRLIDGTWKLVLDESSDVGLPGFRGIGLWIDERAATRATPDDA